MDSLLGQGGAQILGQGLLGIIVIFLLYVIRLREAELKDERTAHRNTIKEYEEKVNDLQDSRLMELKQTLEVTASIKDNLVTFKTAQDLFLSGLQTFLGEVRTLLRDHKDPHK